MYTAIINPIKENMQLQACPPVFWAEVLSKNSSDISLGGGIK